MGIAVDLHDVILLDRAIPYKNVVSCPNADRNDDGFVSFSEAYDNCIEPKYLDSLGRLNARLFSKCAPTIDIDEARKEVGYIVYETLAEIAAVSNVFGPYSEEAMIYLTLRVSLQQISENFVTLPVAEEKGTGQLGISWETSTGMIHVRPNSAGEYAGLKTGDILVRIDDVEFEDAYTEDIMRACFGQCGEIAEVVVDRDGEELTLLIEKGPN